MLRHHYFVGPTDETNPAAPWKVDRNAEALVTCETRMIALAFALWRARADVELGLRAQVHERSSEGLYTVWVPANDTPVYPTELGQRPPAGR